MEQISVNVKVKPQQYIINIGYNILDDVIENLIYGKYGSRYAVITDSTVKKLHTVDFVKKMKAKGLDVLLLDFPAGETSKTRETKQRLDDNLLDNRFGRDSVIIAFGGGVVGDVAGFVAATFMRGIPYIQVPTTIIAQADSSIGGKTAVDYPQGKNLIGAFHHPKSVFIDTQTLSTLDHRTYKSGFSEIIKHGLIRDRLLLEFYEENINYIFSRDDAKYPEVITELMSRNCRIKNEIVAEDAKEQNLRKVLNYGHTIGHAVEHLSGYNLLHGEAVSIGIITEAFFSWKLGYSRQQDFKKQLEIIKKSGLPYKIPEEIANDAILKTMYIDKKVRDKKPEFVLLKEIGKTMVFEDKRTTTPLADDTIITLLKDLRSAI